MSHLQKLVQDVLHTAHTPVSALPRVTGIYTVSFQGKCLLKFSHHLK